MIVVINDNNLRRMIRINMISTWSSQDLAILYEANFHSFVHSKDRREKFEKVSPLRLFAFLKYIPHEFLKYIDQKER